MTQTWEKRRVVVTGAAGVIGRPLVGMLVERGAEVATVDLEPFAGSPHHVEHDLVEGLPAELAGFAPEVVFHLAAAFERTVETAGYWQHSFDHNVLLSHRLLRALSELPSTDLVVFASSYLIYDPHLYTDQEGPVALAEGDAIRPRNLVGVAKYLTERELAFVQEVDRQFRALSARIYRVYGRGSRDVISRWVRAALAGDEIQVYGRDNSFDYIFADDVAEGLVRLAEVPSPPPVVNLGSGRSTPIGRVLEVLEAELGAPVSMRDFPHEAARETSGADPRLLEELTGWRPPTTLAEGIRRLIEFERGSHHAEA